MRVVHIPKVIQIAGAEQHLLTLLPALRSAHVDTRMIVLEKAGDASAPFVQRLTLAGVPTEVLPAPSAQGLVNRDVPALLGQLRGLLRKNAPDIVHTHLIHGDIYGLTAAKLAGVQRVVSSRHNLNPFRRRKWQAMTWAMWRLYSGGIAISDAVHDFVVKVEHAPPEATEDRAAVRQMWGIDADAPIIGSVSRLIGSSSKKGLGHALEAFAQVWPVIPNAHYVISGDGELRPALEAQARQLKLDS